MIIDKGDGKGIQIKLSISNRSYEDKNEIDWSKIIYKQTSISINDLSDIIRKGFCYTCSYKNKEFGISQKNLRNFDTIQLITFDFDNVRNYINLDDVLNILKYKPTIAYSTKNNHIIKVGDIKAYSRFRLIYVVDEPIGDINLYHTLYNAIFNTIDKSIFDDSKKSDHCGRSVTQQFSGNYGINVFQSNIVYNIKDFDYNIESSERIAYQDKVIKTKKDIVINENFLNDLCNLQPTDFISKYSKQYDLINESRVNYNQDHYALLGEDYTYILRDYKITEYKNGKGEIKKIPIRKVIKDGQRRRYKMFIYCQVRKQIKPNISVEELIYNLVYDRQYYFDNEDNQLNNATLVEIAQNAMKYDYKLKSPNKAKYKVDKQYCIENNISARTLRNKVKQIINYEKIGEVYDISLSVKENLIILHDMGLKVSLRTLYRFCKEFGINPKGEKRKESIESNEPKKSEEHTINLNNVIIQDDAIQKALVNYHRPNLQRIYDYLDFTMNKETYNQIYHIAI